MKTLCKTMKKAAALVLLLAACSSFSYAESGDSLRAIRWLLGDWIANAGEKVTRES